MTMTEVQNETTEDQFSPAHPQVSPELRSTANGWERYAKDCIQRMQGVPSIAVEDEMPSKLKSECEKHNTTRDAVVSGFTSLFGPLLALLGKLNNPREQNPGLGELQDAVELTKRNRLSCFQEALDLAVSGEKLIEWCADELEPISKQCEQEYAETVENVKVWLSEGGQGLSATQAGVKGMADSQAAQDQLTFLAKQNDRSRAAWGRKENAKNRYASMRESSRRSKQTADELRQELLRLTASEIRI